MVGFLNGLKTVILLALLTALMLFVGNWLGGPGGLAVALVFVLVLNFVSYWWSDKIVLWMYRAKELPASHRASKIVREVATKAGIPVPKTYLVESANPNAFATGRSPSHAAVAVTTGILGLLDDRELRGVLAHELSHVTNRDTLIQTVAGVIAGVISYLATMAQWAAIFGGFGRDDEGGSGWVGLLVLAIITPIIATILQLALSRTREYAADEGAARLLHDKLGLASALKKLEKGNLLAPMGTADGNPATASLFIVNPFRGNFLFELLATHPSTAKRVAKLEALTFS